MNRYGRSVTDGDAAPVNRRFALTPAAAFAVVGSAVAAVLLQRAFVAAHRPLGWAVACGVVALLLDPLIRLLDRKLPKALAVVASLVGLVALVGIAVFGVVQQVGRSLDTLATAGPEAARRLEDRATFARDVGLVGRVEALVAAMERQVHQAALAGAGSAPTYLVTGILMLFFLAYGRSYLRGALAQISVPRRREAASRILYRGLSRGRNALALTLLQIVAITLLGELTFRAIHVPADFVLALLIGVLSAVPSLGVILGGLPALLVTYGFKGPGLALAVAVLLVAVQLVEGLLLRPRIDERTVPVGPLLPIVVGLVGFQLYGAGGAVYGYAILVLALAIFDEATTTGKAMASISINHSGAASAATPTSVLAGGAPCGKNDDRAER